MAHADSLSALVGLGLIGVRVRVRVRVRVGVGVGVRVRVSSSARAWLVSDVVPRHTRRIALASNSCWRTALALLRRAKSGATDLREGKEEIRGGEEGRRGGEVRGS